MKEFWVTRDRNDEMVSFWRSEPKHISIGWGYGYRVCMLRADALETLTGIKLKGGPRSIIKIKGFKPIRSK